MSIFDSFLVPPEVEEMLAEVVEQEIETLVVETVSVEVAAPEVGVFGLVLTV